MDEESFETKPKKKFGSRIALAIAIIVVIAAIAALAFLFISNKPERIFTSKIKKAFSMAEKEIEDAKSERISLDFSADVESNDASIIMASSIIKAAKLKSVTEVDVDKKILNQKISASYDGTNVLDVDALIQDEKIYLYLNELFGKYLDLSEYIDDELDLSQLFVETDIEASKQLLKDIENTLVETIKEQELEQEKDEVNGKKVTKSTCTLTDKEVLQLAKEIIKDLKNNVKDKETKYMLDDLLDEMDYELKNGYFSKKNYLEISLYTKGIKRDLVKFEMTVFTAGEETMSLEAVKDKNETTIQIRFEGGLLAAVVTEDKKETNIDFYINPYETKLSSAIKVATMNIVEEGKNEGTIKLKAYVGTVMALMDSDYEDTKLDVTLNIKYKVDLNCKIEKKDTSNSIRIDDLTEEDLEKIEENVMKNPFLSSLVEEYLYSGFDDDFYDDYYDDYYFDDEFDYGSDWMDETEEYLEDYIMDIRGY